LARPQRWHCCRQKLTHVVIVKSRIAITLVNSALALAAAANVIAAGRLQQANRRKPLLLLHLFG
jgi:hypothetical protein